MEVIKEYIEAKDKVDKLRDRLSKWEWKLKDSFDCLKQQVTHKGYQDDGDSGTNWWLFPATMSDKEINDALVKLEIVEHTDRGIWDVNDWDCSGQTLVYHPSIKRTKTRVLVTQSWAIDC